MKELDLYKLNLKWFDAINKSTDTTEKTGNDLSPEMKTWYSDYLIDSAEPELIHDQFAQKHPIPQGGGKIIEFRKFTKLPKLTTAISEGVTPTGQKMDVTAKTATVAQYGGFIEMTDILELTAIDNVIVEATRMIGRQAGRTLDTITREVLVGGTNVQYGDGTKSSRSALVGGAASGNDYLTVDCIRKAVRFLKTQNAPKIGDSYVGIIHPDVAYDLMNDPAWEKVKDYDPENWYNGEIGRIAGVRFIETTEAKIFAGQGADDRDVYATMILGADAYGVSEISGGGLQHIVKQLGSSGTADPLNQRSTVGWKAARTAVRLVEENMIRIETCSTFASGEN